MIVGAGLVPARSAERLKLCLKIILSDVNGNVRCAHWAGTRPAPTNLGFVHTNLVAYLSKSASNRSAF